MKINKDDILSSRRSILALGGGLAGAYYLGRAPEPTAALTSLSLSVGDSSVTTGDGQITDVNVLESNSQIEYTWEGYDSTETPTITTEVKATNTSTNDHLGSGAKTYETILQDTASELPDTSGSETVQFSTLYSGYSFPVSIPGNHSGMTVSDFEESNDGQTQTTELAFRVTFDTTSVTTTESTTALVEVTNGQNANPGQQVALSSHTFEPYCRQVVRDSNENLVALVLPDGSNVYPYISTDDGQTWTKGSTGFSHTYDDTGEQYRRNPGLYIDANDKIHLSTTDGSSKFYYNRFSIATDGTVTTDVSGEVVNGDTNSGVGTQGSRLTIDSTGTIWVGHTVGFTSMGSAYADIAVSRRDSAGSWTTYREGFGQTDQRFIRGLHVDTNDDLHVAIAYRDTDTEYAKFDAANTAFVQSTPDHLAAKQFWGELMVVNGTEPVVVTGNTAYHKSSGSWSSAQFSTQTVNAPSIARGSDGDLHIVYDANGDIFQNQASSVGNLDTANEVTLISSADTLERPSVRWQYNNLNNDADGIVDIAYGNATTANTKFYGYVP